MGASPDASGHAPPRIDMIGNTERALQDSGLQDALGRALPTFRRLRSAAVAEVPEWQSLREVAARIKDHALAHLDEHLLRFDAQLSAAGGIVHWASDAAEARRIITDLALTRGVRLAVKSKSMTTEEIHLNPALEAAGVNVVETDLGEYVVQLAGERPSHLIAPIVHKTAESVAELFSEKLGVPRYERPEDLIRVAREKLRAEFLAADMGITGVNFAIAETGTVVVVENEGNARLTTTRPRIHVAVMGIEKVLPRLADLGVLLRLLARSSTGQRASVYVSLLTGPRRTAEHDGPEELHVVILDNGRTRLLADPHLREALRCVRCGACLNVCPVYERAGGHAYDAVYSGPIGAVITPVLEGLERSAELPFASTLCGACAEVCPVKIDLPRMLLELRGRAVRAGLTGRVDRLFARAWTFAMRSPSWLRVLRGLGRVLQRLVVRRGRIERLPYPFAGWTAHRTAPPLASRSFRDRWRSR
ncbi:MAG: LutB/LldF family L-lactate oxidation iron-sulfur protein [Armatimonadota bacterium]